MFRFRWTIFAGLFLLVLLLILLVPGVSAKPGAPMVITVDTGTDPDTSKSKTCITDTPCSLRRAIVQAGKAGNAERPVTIKFDIPKNASEGYQNNINAWELEINATSDPSVFRRLEYGQIIIDGNSQPGGRSDGPKIILIGPGTGNKDGIIVGAHAAGAHDDNVIRGLAFQNFKTHMYINSNDNVVENCWFGLSSNGKEPFLRDDEPEDGSGNAGIALSAGVENNVIKFNVFLGFDGVAAAIRGEDNSFLKNWVGTRSDGKVPNKQTDPDLICTPVDWLGGGGISLEGDAHLVENNIFAGLRQEIFHGSTQPDAISVTGDDHQIFDNVIGTGVNSVLVGVCGRGIYLHGAPEGVFVSENKIINPGLSGISLNGKLSDANTFRSNIIRNKYQWKDDDEFNPAPEDAIQLGPSLPDAFRLFNPARVTEIDGKKVKGSNGIGSPCPKCKIELFLDDKDRIKEAVQPLAVVDADNNGNWTATIPNELLDSQGIRTTSTTFKYNTIPNTSPGTTTGLSDLYIKIIPCTGITGNPFGICLPLTRGK